jgi:hypothetical protein
MTVLVFSVALLAACGGGHPTSLLSQTHEQAPTTSAPQSSPGSTTTAPVKPEQATLVANCGGGAYQPTTLIVACQTSGTMVTDIVWSSWTGQMAHGRGLVNQPNCPPACSTNNAGQFPAELTLASPVPSSRGVEFSELTVAWTASSPDGHPTHTYHLPTD